MKYCVDFRWGSVWIIVVMLLVASYVHAQLIEVSSSLNPVGSGARATGMGGAFIGVADDATAASWNPAGLIQLEKPEFSVVYSYFHRAQEYDSSALPEVAGENTMNANGLNYASVAFPFVMLNRNMIVSLNYQRLFELNKEVTFTLNRSGALPTDSSQEEINFNQTGFLYTISPAYAVQIVPQLYLGATVNFWDNVVSRNGWVNRYTSDAEGTLFGFQFTEKFRQKDKVALKGTNAHFGFMWLVNDSLTLGGVYKTPFKADLKKESSTFQSTDFAPPINSYTETRSSRTDDLIMRMPASYGLGVAYRYSDAWTIALDIYRTQWSKFVIQDEDENEKNPLDGRSISAGRLKDTTQVRLGSEYLFIKEDYVIPARFGIFYDPEPAKGHLDEFYGFSFGSGYAGGRIALDIAYQFRTGNNLTGDIPNIQDSAVDLEQHTVMASAIFYFE